MPIGTSDGSDFGSVGQGFDGPTRFRFRRFDHDRPERNVTISVFPHANRDGLATQIAKTAKQLGLEAVPVWDGPGDEQFVTRILSADPWREDLAQMPEGHYDKATGYTTFGAVCLKIPKRRGGQMEISYVTWSFYEAGDYSTSVVVKIVPPLYETPQEFAELKNAATKLADKLAAWLRSEPLSPASVLLRKRMSG